MSLKTSGTARSSYRTVALLVAITVGGCSSSTVPAATTPAPNRASDPGVAFSTAAHTDAVRGLLGDDTARLAVALARPVAACVRREDTAHPAFHGCIDWHSAVHGNYALRAAARLTGRSDLRDAATEVATAPALNREAADLVNDRLEAELPYGFAWFLILDVEAAVPAMAPIAREARDRLSAWVFDHLDDLATLRSQAYANLSFAVYALHEWAQEFDPNAARTIRAITGPALVNHIDQTCVPPGRPVEFFDPCANLLLALSAMRVADATVVDYGVVEDLATTALRPPALQAEQVLTVHAAGLIFSRAWSAYEAARALADTDLVDVGDRYVRATVESPELWREDYSRHAHWVAQFGIRALDLRADAAAGLVRQP